MKPLISKCSMIPAWHQLVPISGHVEESETARKLQLYAASIKTSVSTRLIGETGRKFNTRLEEHKSEVNKVSGTVTTRACRKESLTTNHKSAVTDHASGQESCYWMGEAKIIGTEQDRYKHSIKEAIAIKKKGGTTMKQRWRSIFPLTCFWWDFDEEKTPNWQINWQHWKWQHRHQKTVNISLITVMIKAIDDCRNVHSKLFYLDQNLRNFCLLLLIFILH